MEAHALRQRYLDKVKAVEYSTKVRDSNKEEGKYENLYSIETPSGHNMEDNISDVGGSSNGGSQISVDAGKYYPTMGLTNRIIEDYRKNYPINTLGEINYSISKINNGKSISIPAGSRHQYSATIVRYIESIGGITKDRNMFGTIDMNRFTLSGLDDYELNDHGNWLRKDMIYYMNRLYDIVAPKLGVKYLQINSAYRSPRVNYKVHTEQGGNIVYWDSHMAGLAIDIAAKGEARSVIADAAYNMGFRAIAIGGPFVHIDCNSKGNWKYSGVPKYYSPSNPGPSAYR